MVPFVLSRGGKDVENKDEMQGHRTESAADSRKHPEPELQPCGWLRLGRGLPGWREGRLGPQGAWHTQQAFRRGHFCTLFLQCPLGKIFPLAQVISSLEGPDLNVIGIKICRMWPAGQSLFRGEGD